MRIKTNWSNLCSPYICGLLASNPSLYSATLHNTGYKALDIPFTYHAFKVGDLSVPIQAMNEMGFRGYSVTIPFKEEAMKFVDEISHSASAIGAINTIVNDGSTLHGTNTDWVGIQKSLLELSDDYEGQTALIIGAGGAAKAAIYALKRMKLSKITIVNRTIKRSKEAAHEFDINYIETSKLNSRNLPEFDLIVNATPLAKIDFLPYNAIHNKQTIFEMITAETELTISARKSGAQVATGLRMLIYQGLEQFNLFTEKSLDIKEVETALISLYERNNIKK